ncbi:starvation-inducible DNA-binding protein [Fontibacillus panacisegetis]|uniref:Starvation-inducible DNA-binding protein n=1 Tax=Fontibacillus panacisegetis TaxID=670482 RepID=A0A1G7R0Y7_9BACL|nr:Dps family protein [Fontibacillus panacisegetis]SDG04426.1 starvation-inducible DNA-binding protein [Fontibacillus panacisegetis]
MTNQVLTQSEQALEKELNLQIANWTVLYTKLHNFHWYVKGSNFFRLHEKFEELYNEAANYIDEIAERLLAIGGRPVATLSDSLAVATLSEATGSEDANAMVESIIADFKVLGSELKHGMKIADEAEDQASGDLLLGILSTIEKHSWMLNSYLGK